MSTNPNIVPLTYGEIRQAAFGGLMRWVTCRELGRKFENGRNDLGIERDAVGAVAEYAVAKQYNRCWVPHLGVLDTNIGDVANLQVKSITKPNFSLIVQKDDNPTFPFLLVYVNFEKPAFAQMMGWIMGKDAKDGKWLKHAGEAGIHQTAFFVPQSALCKMEEFWLTP